MPFFQNCRFVGISSLKDEGLQSRSRLCTEHNVRTAASHAVVQKIGKTIENEIDRPLKGSYGQFSDLLFLQVHELQKHPRRKS